MPVQVPATFASAAASSTQTDGGASGRNSSGSVEWPRARPNGATQTFRRSSQATTPTSSRENLQQPQPPLPSGGTYVPPHQNPASSNSQTSTNGDSRFSKDQLLDLWKDQLQGRGACEGQPDIFTEGWMPGSSSDSSNGGWQPSKNSKKVSGGPEICWDAEGSVTPLGLISLSEEEKELFGTSVNSPLKGPPQSHNKDGGPQTPGVNGRKSSVSQVQSGGNQGGRPGVRRRDTSDSLPSNNPLASPTSYASRTFKDEGQVTSPPPSLMRRRTDFKEVFEKGLMSFGERTKLDTGGLDSNSPFGSFKKGAGPMSAGITGPSSPWANAGATGPQSAGFGAFGNFGLDPGAGQPSTPGDKKAGFGSIRGESRFKGLMSKDSPEENSSSKEKPNLASVLDRLAEAERSDRQNAKWGQDSPMRLSSKGSHFFDDLDQSGVGSAALGGDDAGPPTATDRSFHSRLSQQRPQDEVGFSTFNSLDTPTFRDLAVQRREAGSQEPPQGRNLYSGQLIAEPMSPTSTNPYQQSPGGEKSTEETDSDEDGPSNPYGARGAPLSAKNFSAVYDGADRSENSSAGGVPLRGRQAIGSLGGAMGAGGASSGGGWSAAPGAIGFPTSRGSVGFPGSLPDSIFGSMGEASSAGMFASPAPHHYGAFGRGSSSKLGALTQDSMPDQPHGDHGFGERGGPPGGFGNVPGRDTDSPARQNRGVLDDLFGKIETMNRAPGAPSPFTTGGEIQTTTQVSSLPPAQAGIATTVSTSGSSIQAVSKAPAPPASESPSNQMSQAQQKQMVMPDRMRWIYRDPQGKTQGPWSGLEMHDWYKAGFFSPELQVKKQEDADYEPLAQLIRRIGNSREPFLVPQIGIPHGDPAPSSAGGSGSGNKAAGASSTLPAGTAQPPFASNFPSFGTTLTAEQQNALERRKQEEQFLMARQKEHLAQHQILVKQFAMQVAYPQALHHHSSAHSLHSQPSHGSISSPPGPPGPPGAAFQPSPVPPPPPMHPPGGPMMPGFFDGRPLQQQQPPPPQYPPPMAGYGGDMMASRDNGPNASMERLNMTAAGQPPYVAHPHAPGLPEGMLQQPLQHQQQVANLLQERARLQREQEKFGPQLSEKETMERLEQYHKLRAQQDKAEMAAAVAAQSAAGMHPESHGNANKQKAIDAALEKASQDVSDPRNKSLAAETALLQQPINAPAPPISPLPAPAARRNRKHVAENLNTEMHATHSRTPSQDTPSSAVAPWAKENNEGGQKGPSLKEIQETEARKTAKRDEMAAAQRRALAEQERLALAQQAQNAQPTAGLPSSSNWATNAPTPAVKTPGSAWSKKTAVATPVTGAKKTLAQIQKEEEARKNRAAAAAATAASIATATAGGASSSVVLPGGKRYADLASKAPVPTGPAAAGGAWTTVGASGKAKVVSGPGGVPAPTRSASGSAATPSAAATTSKPKPTQPTRSNTQIAAAQSANVEFQKWAKMALSKGLSSTINVDEFVRNLMQLPTDAEIIAEAVYASSKTLEGNRFAEEFIRRRRLADRGIPPEASASAVSFASTGGDHSGNGGWNEVAKKGNASNSGATGSGAGNGAGASKHAGEAAAFKVVAPKKKGKK